MEQGNSRIADGTGHLEIERDQCKVRRLACRLGRGSKRTGLDHAGGGRDAGNGHRQGLPEQRMVIGN